jgi:thiol-disulfide isomerase/thioredoxin
MTQKVRAASFAILALATLEVGCAGAPKTRRGPPPPPDVVGKTLALEAPALDGRMVSLLPSAGKVRVVEMWASWCEPCRHAMPQLDEISRDLGALGVEVYGVAVDDEREAVTAFLADVPVGFTILWDRAGERASAAQLPVVRLPTTLVVDRRGVIRFVHEGWTERVGREQRTQVESLLRE